MIAKEYNATDELKTAKDLVIGCSKYPNCSGECARIRFDELRQEAIKQIKWGIRKNKEGKWLRWKEIFLEFYDITKEDLDETKN